MSVFTHHHSHPRSMNKRSTPTLSTTTTSKRHSHSSHPASTTSLPLSRPSSRSGTPRSHARTREPTMTTTTSAPLEPPTPTPKKHHRARGAKKHKDHNTRAAPDQELDLDDVQHDDANEQISGEDDQALFDLLGVPTPPATAELAQPAPEKGVLRLSEETMDAARGKQRQPRRRKQAETDTGVADGKVVTSALTASRPAAKGKPAAAGADETCVTSEGEPRRSKRLEGKNAPGQGRRMPKSSKQAFDTSASAVPITLGDGNGNASRNDPMDMTSLSRSLPSGFVPPQSSGWDMPTNGGTQELTWQQKLQAQAEDTPSKRGSKPPNSDRKRKPAANGHTQPTSDPVPPTAYPTGRHPSNPPAHPGMHARRASLDHVPTPTPASFPNMTSSSSMPVSAFDSSIPFHTGFNVHRAPQTPAKTAASRALNGGAGNGGGGPLSGSPVMGEFPRLKGSSSASTPNSHHSAGFGHGQGHGQGQTIPSGGMRYAGPTFHNSPHAGALPKPDLDDF